MWTPRFEVTWNKNRRKKIEKAAITQSTQLIYVVQLEANDHRRRIVREISL